MFFSACNSNTHTLFKKLLSSETGIEFNNRIVENDSINPIDPEFLYNGGGVAVSDFNKDLPDLYFTAITTSNKLYLNKGNLKFKDITAIGGKGEWSNAASVVDIANDGLEDIYVCTTIKKENNFHPFKKWQNKKRRSISWGFFFITIIFIYSGK